MTMLFKSSLFCFFIMVLFGCQPKPDVTINIIETTDLHGYFFDFDFTTNQPIDHSLSRISSFVDSLRTHGDREVVLLDNGDLLQGQPVVYYSNVIDTSGPNLGAAVLNYLHYDAAAPGNHDIECGHAVFDKVNHQLNCPWLAANILDEKTMQPYFKPYTIIYRKGVKIAVLGLCTPGIPDWVPHKLWKGLAFEDMIISAKKWVPLILEKENPDLLIGLFHSGIDPNYGNQNEHTYKNENAARIVAEQVPGFDIVFAGHDHKAFNGMVINQANDTVLLLNGGCHAYSFALVNASFKYNKKDKKYQVAKLSPQICQPNKQEDNQQFVANFSSQIEKTKTFTSKSIGTITNSISTRTAYFGSNAFIDMIHRVQLSASGADISFAAPLSFDATIKAGNITVADLFQLYKYENLLYVLNLSGIEVDRYLEFTTGLWFNQMHSVNDHLINLTQDEQGKYRLASQYYNLCSAAGIEYLVDVSKPVGDRVRILGLSNGTPFNENTIYKVAMNSYRGSGGGGHLKAAGLSDEEIANRLIWSSKEDIRLLVMVWIEKQKAIKPTTLNNWRIIPEDFYEEGKRRDAQLLFGSTKN